MSEQMYLLAYLDLAGELTPRLIDGAMRPAVIDALAADLAPSLMHHIGGTGSES